MILTGYGNWKPTYTESLVAMLRDKDPGVRHAVVFALPRFGGDLEKFIPALQEMLKDPDASARAGSLEILERLNIEADISRADLLSFFTSPDYLVLNAAFSQLGGQRGKISADEALVMVQSPQPVARLLGLHALDQLPEKASVEFALPLLRDPEEMVRLKASQTLRALTGQTFSEDQPDEWMQWWVKNKTNFVVRPHPEELRLHGFQN
jgi:HEAT repeat protein